MWKGRQVWRKWKRLKEEVKYKTRALRLNFRFQASLGYRRMKNIHKQNALDLQWTFSQESLQFRTSFSSFVRSPYEFIILMQVSIISRSLILKLCLLCSILKKRLEKEFRFFAFFLYLPVPASFTFFQSIIDFFSIFNFELMEIEIHEWFGFHVA